MSNQTNTNLLELASEHISYWEGEGIGAVLEADLDRDDLESLKQHLIDSTVLMAQLEYNPEPTTPETINAWGDSLIGDGDIF